MLMDRLGQSVRKLTDNRSEAKRAILSMSNGLVFFQCLLGLSRVSVLGIFRGLGSGKYRIGLFGW